MLNATAHTIKTSKQESGYLNKSKDIELPSINRTTGRTNNLRSTSSSSRSLMTDKIQWIARTVTYDNLSEYDINEEYKRLRETLKNLNVELAKILERSQLSTIRSPAKAVQPEHLAQVRDQEIVNNCKMINFYRLEYAKLQKRVSQIGENSKEGIQREIIRVKSKITKTVLLIKQLRKKSNTLGNSIVDTDSLVKEMRALEEEKSVYQTKKFKNFRDLEKVENNMKQTEQKMIQITEQYRKAEQVLKEFQQQNTKEKESKRSEMNLFQKKLLLESTKKRVESTKSQNQQNYLRKLKQLQANVTQLNSHSNKITNSQQLIMQSRITIKQLEDRLKLKKQKQNERQQAETVFLTKPIQLDFTNYHTHAPSRITLNTENNHHDKSQSLEPTPGSSTHREASGDIIPLKIQSSTINICQNKEDISTHSEKNQIEKSKSKKKVMDFTEQSPSEQRNQEKLEIDEVPANLNQKKEGEKGKEVTNKQNKVVHQIQIGTEWDNLINDDQFQPENIVVKPEPKPSPKIVPQIIDEDDLQLKKKKLLEKLQQYELDEST